MEIARRLLNLMLARHYQMTDHALESLDEEGFVLNDVLSCLATGRLRGGTFVSAARATRWSSSSSCPKT